MRQLEVLHEIELKLLQTVISICQRHKINYFMIGGSLLGAVRHQGFIPWDDDIDIGFTRPEYDRFLAVAAKELLNEQQLITDVNTQNYGFAFSKIVATNTEMIETYNLPNNAVHQVYIDLFPFDSIADDSRQRQKQYRQFKYFNRLIIERLHYGHDDSLKKRIFIVVLNYLNRFRKITTLKAKRLTVMQAFEHQAGSHDRINLCSQYTYGKEIMKSGELAQFTNVPFENLTVSVPTAYDAILSRMYGDYMELPPKEKQVEKHLSNFKVNQQSID